MFAITGSRQPSPVCLGEDVLHPLNDCLKVTAQFQCTDSVSLGLEQRQLPGATVYEGPPFIYAMGAQSLEVQDGPTAAVG